LPYLGTLCLVEHWDEAERELANATAPPSSDVTRRYYNRTRAQIYLGQKRYEEAYRFGLQDPELRPYAALAYAYLSEFEMAHRTLDMAKKTTGDNANTRAKIFLLEGRYEEAVEAYDRALRLIPVPKALEGLAEALEGIGDYEEAAYFWKKAISATPFLSESHLVGLERSLLGYGNADEAAKAHKAIIDLRKKEAVA
jgi:tetratricopeptide (TPR) repeat protein